MQDIRQFKQEHLQYSGSTLAAQSIEWCIQQINKLVATCRFYQVYFIDVKEVFSRAVRCFLFSDQLMSLYTHLGNVQMFRQYHKIITKP